MIIMIEILEKLYFTINCKIIILQIDFIESSLKKIAFICFTLYLFHFISLSKSTILKDS